MLLRIPVTTIALIGFAPVTSAQSCRMFPPGPERFECFSRNHPGATAKLERCRDEARGMGLSRHTGGRALREYVQACMQRR
jgi:hypothetical protein